MKKFKKIILTFFLINFASLAHADSGYMFGGAKVFNYGIDRSDLQAINTSLVNLGFSSSGSSTDNTGVGFEIGAGVHLSPEIAIEAGYVNYGTLEIKTKTTGPVENITTEIDGNGVTAAGVFIFGDQDDHAYIKAGMHSWEFTGTVTASLGTSSEPLGSGTDPFFSVGYKGAGWYAGYDHYTIDDGDISSISFGYASQF